MESPPRLLLTSPLDVLAAVPYLLGFHPEESLVVIGLAGGPPRGRLRVTTRWDLPFDRDAADRLLTLLRREETNRIIIVGYGAGPLVTPAVDEVRRMARAAGIAVIEALRVEDGRFWSYVCTSPACCPAEGTPYDPCASQVPAQATFHGMVALPDRKALEASVAACSGEARRAMRAATDTVVAETLARLHARRNGDALAGEFVADGLSRVRRAIAASASRTPLCDAEAARLGVALHVIRVRDEAWTLMNDDDLDAHLALWADLTRRLEPRFLPPAASLLAMAAWRCGDCALAGVALQRALEADPGYSMANLLAYALRSMLSPAALRERMPTPADLDAAMGRPRMSWLRPVLTLLQAEYDAVMRRSDRERR